MASPRLNEKQIAAITILAQPKRGGLTNDQVADEVGIARSTFYEWKKKDYFQAELKRQIVRNTTDRLPEVFDSIVEDIIKNGNAASFRTLVQLHGLLVDKVEVETKTGSGDTDAMRAEIERIKRGNSGSSDIDMSAL